jgi:hypothetical protein
VEFASAAVGFEHELPATTRSLRALRRAFRKWTEGLISDDAVRADLVLATSELCSTAMRVADRGAVEAPLTVRAWVDGFAMVIEIRDPADRVIEGDVRVLEADDTSRALSIVATLADVLTVRAAGHDVLLRARKERVIADSGRRVAGVR